MRRAEGVLRRRDEVHAWKLVAGEGFAPLERPSLPAAVALGSSVVRVGGLVDRDRKGPWPLREALIASPQVAQARRRQAWPLRAGHRAAARPLRGAPHRVPASSGIPAARPRTPAFLARQHLIRNARPPSKPTSRSGADRDSPSAARPDSPRGRRRIWPFPSRDTERRSSQARTRHRPAEGRRGRLVPAIGRYGAVPGARTGFLPRGRG